jgi:sortase A
MRDKRPVDELSIEELERILAIRKQEARQARLRRYQNSGRRVVTPDDADDNKNAPGDVEMERTPEPATVAATPSPTPPAEPPVPAPPDYDDGAPHFEDELDRRARGGVSGPQPTLKKLIWNRLLLLVEVAAALGLVLLLVILFQSIQELTQTTADIQAQYQATANARLVPPTATPLINFVAVLPVGHTVKVNDQGDVIDASFNLDEVPAQYRDQYQAQLAQPPIQPTRSPEGPIRLRIPKIRIDSPVVIGDDWSTLQLGVGYHIGSANPGQVGNMILSAHNDVYGEIFRHLDQLEPGDQVVVSSTTREYTYVVRERQIVRPTDTWVMESRGDDKQLTLISCYPYRVDNRRIVVFATLLSP